MERDRRCVRFLAGVCVSCAFPVYFARRQTRPAGVRLFPEAPAAHSSEQSRTRLQSVPCSSRGRELRGTCCSSLCTPGTTAFFKHSSFLWLSCRAQTRAFAACARRTNTSLPSCVSEVSSLSLSGGCRKTSMPGIPLYPPHVRMMERQESVGFRLMFFSAFFLLFLFCRGGAVSLRAFLFFCCCSFLQHGTFFYLLHGGTDVLLLRSQWLSPEMAAKHVFEANEDFMEGSRRALNQHARPPCGRTTLGQKRTETEQTDNPLLPCFWPPVKSPIVVRGAPPRTPRRGWKKNGGPRMRETTKLFCPIFFFFFVARKERYGGGVVLSRGGRGARCKSCRMCALCCWTRRPLWCSICRSNCLNFCPRVRGRTDRQWEDSFPLSERGAVVRTRNPRSHYSVAATAAAVVS